MTRLLSSSLRLIAQSKCQFYFQQNLKLQIYIELFNCGLKQSIRQWICFPNQKIHFIFFVQKLIRSWFIKISCRMSLQLMCQLLCSTMHLNQRFVQQPEAD